MAYRKPLPVADERSAAYWDGARHRQLMIQRCSACGRWIHYPKATCPACGGTELRPMPVSGRGVVYTFTVSHYLGAPGFDDEVPYVVVLVELEEQEGLRVVGNLRDCSREQLHVGMPVEVLFEDVTPEVTLPQFRPRRA